MTAYDVAEWAEFANTVAEVRPQSRVCCSWGCR